MLEIGLCQGDLLSHFLFLIVADGLIVMMNAILKKGFFFFWLWGEAMLKQRVFLKITSSVLMITRY